MLNHAIEVDDGDGLLLRWRLEGVLAREGGHHGGLAFDLLLVRRTRHSLLLIDGDFVWLHWRLAAHVIKSHVVRAAVDPRLQGLPTRYVVGLNHQLARLLLRHLLPGLCVLQLFGQLISLLHGGHLVFFELPGHGQPLELRPLRQLL